MALKKPWLGFRSTVGFLNRIYQPQSRYNNKLITGVQETKDRYFQKHN